MWKIKDALILQTELSENDAKELTNFISDKNNEIEIHKKALEETYKQIDELVYDKKLYKEALYIAIKEDTSKQILEYKGIFSIIENKNISIDIDKYVYEKVLYGILDQARTALKEK